MAKSHARTFLLTTVSRLEGPPPLPDYADIRFEISRRLLARKAPMQPVVLRHPWAGNVVYVEGEPDNWREFIEEHGKAGTLEQVIMAAAIEGRAH